MPASPYDDLLGPLPDMNDPRVRAALDTIGNPGNQLGGTGDPWSQIPIDAFPEGQRALIPSSSEGLPPLSPWESPGREAHPPFGGVIDLSLADPLDADRLMEVDWKLERKRRQWEKQEGMDWPRRADGRRFDGHHTTPKAYGGSDGLDNFQPMDPLEHRRHHMENGDFRTWGSWSRGNKPNRGPDVKGLGLLGVIPDITGILSGRIRTDTFDNFASDMMGTPSQEDLRKAFEEEQRRINPKWKPGDPFMI